MLYKLRFFLVIGLVVWLHMLAVAAVAFGWILDVFKQAPAEKIIAAEVIQLPAPEAPAAPVPETVQKPKTPKPPKTPQDKPIPQSQPQPKPQRTLVAANTSSAASETAAPATEPTQPPASTKNDKAEASAPPVEVKPAETKPVAMAQYTSTSVQYPMMSRRMGEEGRVLLKVMVAADGSVDGVKLLQSSGYERLDSAALQAVRDWRFKPGKRGNEAQAMAVNVPIIFDLDHQGL